MYLFGPNSFAFMCVCMHVSMYMSIYVYLLHEMDLDVLDLCVLFSGLA